MFDQSKDKITCKFKKESFEYHFFLSKQYAANKVYTLDDLSLYCLYYPTVTNWLYIIATPSDVTNKHKNEYKI